MTHPTIKTPKGETLVVVPIDDYESLCDAADHAKAMAALARGDEETLTPAEALALAGAPTPLAFWRAKRGLTQTALAEAVGVSQNYLSQLEAAKRNGDAALFKKLAAALHVAMEDLVA